MAKIEVLFNMARVKKEFNHNNFFFEALYLFTLCENSFNFCTKFKFTKKNNEHFIGVQWAQFSYDEITLSTCF